jgi:recombination protein RecR
MNPIAKLEEIFAHFPGIGPRQARRFVHYIQGRSPATISELVELINKVKSSTMECSRCHRFFTSNDSSLAGNVSLTNGVNSKSNIKKSSTICAICNDPERDHTTLMIVAHDSDLESIEKSGAYKGLYFVLGGTVPILDKDPEKRIRLKSLLERVAQENEIILSLNTTPDGDHTANIVKDALSKIMKTPSNSFTKTDSVSLNGSPSETVSIAPKITILGRGLSTGAELEYADGETIRNALGNRTNI